jgi:flavorubredoxin
MKSSVGSPQLAMNCPVDLAAMANGQNSDVALSFPTTSTALSGPLFICARLADCTSLLFAHFAAAFATNEYNSYFANVLLRLQKPLLKALQTAAKLPGINVVLPAHGVGLRRPQDIATGVKLYTDWATQVPSAKSTFLYDCNWFGTEKLAEAIASGAGKVGGVDVKMFHARRTHITKVVTELVDTAALAVGSACLHNSILPDLTWDLNSVRSLAICGKAVVEKEIRAQLFGPTKVQEVAPPVMALWSPSDDDLAKAEKLGMALGNAARTKAAAGK